MQIVSHKLLLIDKTSWFVCAQNACMQRPFFAIRMPSRHARAPRTHTHYHVTHQFVLKWILSHFALLRYLRSIARAVDFICICIRTHRTCWLPLNPAFLCSRIDISFDLSQLLSYGESRPLSPPHHFFHFAKQVLFDWDSQCIQNFRIYMFVAFILLVLLLFNFNFEQMLKNDGKRQQQRLQQQPMHTSGAKKKKCEARTLLRCDDDLFGSRCATRVRIHTLV